MKQNFFLAIACVLILAGCAEKVINRQPVDITVKFKNREIEGIDELQKMKPGNFYRVIIKEINLNAWKVKIGNHDSSATTPLTFPTFASMPISSLQDAVKSLTSLGGAVVAGAPGLKLSDNVLDFTSSKMMKDGKDFDKAYNRQLYLRLRNENPTTPAPSRAHEIRALLTANERALKVALCTLQCIRREIDNVLLLANQTVLNEQLEPRMNLFGRGISAADLLTRVTTYRTSLDTLSRWVVRASSSFSEARVAYATEIEAKPEFKSLDQQIKKSYLEFEPAIASVKTPLNADNISKVFSQYVAIGNSGEFYRSLPIQFTSEISQVNVDITPRSENSGLNPYRLQLTFPAKTFDKFWGVSSGFYLSTPANDAYSTRVNIEADTTYSLVAENSGKLEIGFNTMLRYGRRLRASKVDNNLYWHIGIGPGISVSDKVRPRMLLGTGLALGEDHTLVIDVGAIVGYYDVKSEVFNEPGPYAVMPEKATVSKLKGGFYFSIGYLFLK